MEKGEAVYSYRGYTASFEGNNEAKIIRDDDNTEVARTSFCSGDDVKYLKEYLKTYLALRTY